MKKYLSTIKGYIILSIIFSLSEAVITSVILLFPGWLVDNFQNGMAYIVKLAILYVLSFSIYLLVSFFSNRIADYRRIKFEEAIKKDFFQSIISRDFEKYHEFSSEEYISMQANDITEMCQNYLSPLLSIYRSLLLIGAFGVSLIVFVNYYIAAVIFLFSLIVVFIPKLTAKDLAIKNKRYMDVVGKYTFDIGKIFEAHDILDHRSKNKLIEIHSKKIENVFAHNMNFRKTNSFAMVINGGSVEFVSVITFVVVAILLLRSKITVGMATIAFTYSTRFMEPIYELNVCLGKVHSVKKVQEKILNIIGNSIVNKSDSFNIQNITTTQLTKRYKQTEIMLPQTSFEYPKKYLITGENGVGKSVFLRLLMQFEKADSGTIEYNGINDIDISEDICYVPQNPVIFNASYVDNVTIFNAYDSNNLERYESFFPKELLDNIKQNTNTENLSGGEKQVIAFLRALCSEKRIIMMDEPFSAMNNISIAHFMKHMDSIDRMMLIIAHNVEEYEKAFDETIVISR
ncbi:MAG: ABC transporter ATP-binding protein/permease [Acetatifactor sp.]|nr:ABC transporter ATP-binding protein/permease [Acetatifactor sp.]